MGSSDGRKVRGSSDPLSSLFFVRFVLPERHQTGRQRPDRTGPRSLSGSQHGKLQKVLALPAFLVQNAVSQRGVTHCDASLARAEIGRRNGASGHRVMKEWIIAYCAGSIRSSAPSSSSVNRYKYPSGPWRTSRILCLNSPSSDSRRNSSVFSLNTMRSR